MPLANTNVTFIKHHLIKKDWKLSSIVFTIQLIVAPKHGDFRRSATDDSFFIIDVNLHKPFV